MGHVCVVSYDLDGTVCLHQAPDIGPPRPIVIGALQLLVEEGWKAILNTSRVNAIWPEPSRTKGCQEMLDWLHENRVPFHAAWGLLIPGALAAVDVANRCRISRSDPYEKIYSWAFTALDLGKPLADLYWDDRGVELGPGGLDRFKSPEDLAWYARTLATALGDPQHSGYSE